MMIPVYTTTGTKKESLSVGELAVNALLVAQAVRVHLSNKRQGTAKTKSRGEVDLTKKKWYKQKHTGGARHGARSAPIFVGGGVTHGPRGNANWTLFLSKPMRSQAMVSAIGMQAEKSNLMVVEGLNKVDAKTKSVAKLITDLKLADQKVLVLTETTLEPLVRAARNLPQVLVGRADRTNVFEILAADKIVVTPEAWELLTKRMAGKSEPKVVKTESKPAKKVVQTEAIVETAKETTKKPAVKTTAKKTPVKKSTEK
jgi:large subunit ribosomal protein L4